MAAPIGHIVCALSLLTTTPSIKDHNSFFAGTSFPDIRYVTDISRRATHLAEDKSLPYLIHRPSAFEAGRLFHVYVDRKREQHMRAHNAYRFIKGPLETQTLKLVEDYILFERIKGKINTSAIFDKIYPEELAFGVSEPAITTWHLMLKEYLDDSRWFDVHRYYRALKVFKEAYSGSAKLFNTFWNSVRTVGFLIYAYVQVVRLSHNDELRAIILDFYDNKFPKIIRMEKERMSFPIEN